jgi:hypothetical protein
LPRYQANYTGETLRNRIIALKKSALYENTNFTHFRELLEERENIVISYTALTNILKDAGVVSKRNHRGAGRKFTRWKRNDRRRRGCSRGEIPPL